MTGEHHGPVSLMATCAGCAAAVSSALAAVLCRNLRPHHNADHARPYIGCYRTRRLKCTCCCTTSTS
ncbi:hypothetical protein V6N13_129181 [Hibiscus sabdariffa]